MVDDAADETGDASIAQESLRAIQTAMTTPTGDGTDLIGAFAEVARRTRIESLWVEDLIRGVRSDLGNVRIADDAALMQYCYRVAGTVGLMMCRVLNVPKPEALPYAVALGIAMQLTNICRDVLEDAQKDRVYLPHTRLSEVGVSPQHLIDGTADAQAVTKVVRDLLHLAEQYYQKADIGIALIPTRARLAIFIASRIYRAIGLRIISHLGGNPLRGRAVVPWYHKVYWLSAAWIAWLRTLISRSALPPQDDLLVRYLEPGSS
jgi:phytoene synthase